MSKAAAFIRSEFQLLTRSILGWTIAIFLIVSMTNAFFPSIKGAEELDEIFNQLPDALQPLFGNVQLSTPMGYLLTETYLFFLPAIMLVYAIGRGAFTLAGEEEAGTLDLLLSQPISRTALYLLKTFVLLVTITWLTSVAMLPTLLYGSAFELDIPAKNLISITVSLTALIIFFALFAQGIAAATGRRVFGLALASGFAFISYLLDGLGQAIEWLEPIRVFTPWNWYNAADSMFEAKFLPGSLVLIGAGLVFLLIGLYRFDKRTLSS
jgi:ABC-2 type transport system permease protein